jgi:hypothetical protein
VVVGDDVALVVEDEAGAGRRLAALTAAQDRASAAAAGGRGDEDDARRHAPVDVGDAPGLGRRRRLAAGRRGGGRFGGRALRSVVVDHPCDGEGADDEADGYGAADEGDEGTHGPHESVTPSTHPERSLMES